MNEVELSAILYYADFLSLKNTSTTVTDSCKYFFVHGVPMNVRFIINQLPTFDQKNEWFQQSIKEYTMLKDKYGDEGALSFLDNICNLGVAGSVNAIQMLKYIHQYSDNWQRNKAFKTYKEFLKSKKYTITTINDKDELEERECTKYVAHFTENLQNSKRS